jgi:hypothetical protein
MTPGIRNFWFATWHVWRSKTRALLGAPSLAAADKNFAVFLESEPVTAPTLETFFNECTPHPNEFLIAWDNACRAPQYILTNQRLWINDAKANRHVDVDLTTVYGWESSISGTKVVLQLRDKTLIEFNGLSAVPAQSLLGLAVRRSTKQEDWGQIPRSPTEADLDRAAVPPPLEPATTSAAWADKAKRREILLMLARRYLEKENVKIAAICFWNAVNKATLLTQMKQAALSGAVGLPVPVVTMSDFEGELGLVVVAERSVFVLRWGLQPLGGTSLNDLWVTDGLVQSLLGRWSGLPVISGLPVAVQCWDDKVSVRGALDDVTFTISNRFGGEGTPSAQELRKAIQDILKSAAPVELLNSILGVAPPENPAGGRFSSQRSCLPEGVLQSF